MVARMNIPKSLAPPPVWNEGIALFQDFDGSLVEIAPHPSAVVVTPVLQGLLHNVQQALGGALALVSGRRLNELDHLLPRLQFAGAGAHGAELRNQQASPVAATQHASLHNLAEALRIYFLADPRIVVEDKTLSVALHYRQAVERGAECDALMRDFAAASGLSLCYGKCVVEALPAGIDKGSAVRSLMALPPFKGRVPVFVGDDLTDEHGIAAVQAMGGYGIKVGSGSSAARYRLNSVRDVHRWLAEGLAAIRVVQQPAMGMEH